MAMDARAMLWCFIMLETMQTELCVRRCYMSIKKITIPRRKIVLGLFTALFLYIGDTENYSGCFASLKEDS